MQMFFAFTVGASKGIWTGGNALWTYVFVLTGLIDVDLRLSRLQHRMGIRL